LKNKNLKDAEDEKKLLAEKKKVKDRKPKAEKKPVLDGAEIEKQDPILYRAKILFEELYFQTVQVPYHWANTRAASGREWKGMKDLVETLKTGLVKANERAEIPKIDYLPTDDEVLNNLKLFIEKLPFWHRANNFTPFKLHKNYNEIVASIRTAKTTGSTQPKPNSYENQDASTFVTPKRN
jgi:hypothetical protein